MKNLTLEGGTSHEGNVNFGRKQEFSLSRQSTLNTAETMAGGNNQSKDENRAIYTGFICRRRILENFNIFGIMTSQTQNFSKKKSTLLLSAFQNPWLEF